MNFWRFLVATYGFRFRVSQRKNYYTYIINYINIQHDLKDALKKELSNKIILFNENYLSFDIIKIVFVNQERIPTRRIGL